MKIDKERKRAGGRIGQVKAIFPAIPQVIGYRKGSFEEPRLSLSAPARNGPKQAQRENSN
jgi:hypothetical protein